MSLASSADRIYIPRNFFIKNVQNIFPKDAKCQINKEGYFTCQCDEDYKKNFGNFKFIAENGEIFCIDVTFDEKEQQKDLENLLNMQKYEFGIQPYQLLDKKFPELKDKSQYFKDLKKYNIDQFKK